MKHGTSKVVLKIDKNINEIFERVLLAGPVGSAFFFRCRVTPAIREEAKVQMRKDAV